MRLLTLLVLMLAVAAPAAGAAVKPPTADPTANGRGGAAATVDPYATQAAIRVLRRGGNAIDAAIAAAGVLGVVEPYSAGIGGGGFMVIRTRKGRLVTIDGRETAPAAFTPTSFIDPETNQPIPFPEAVTSGLGVGVPGTVRTWELAARRYGSMKLRRLLKPAIRLARRGIVVDETLAQQTEANAARFADFPATAAIYLPGGQPLQAGTELRQTDLADTYAAIARRGSKALHEGAIAADIVRTVKEPPVREGATRRVRPGVMEDDDLRNYRALRRPAARSEFRGFTIAGMGPPSSGASTIGETLNIVEAFGREPATEYAGLMHQWLEASRLAYADRGAYLGDPDFVDVPLACLLSQQFANARRALIGEVAGTSPAAAGECSSSPPAEASAAAEGPSTTHLSVADRKGNVVSYTLTIEQTGGSGIVVPGRGFLLNNELTDFDFSPGRANSAAGGKRPRSSMSPTIVLRRGRPVLAVGSPGGSTIITTVGQVLLNVIDAGMSLPEAVAAPRASQRNTARTDAEPAFLQSPAAAALASRGHQFNEVAELGAVAAIALRRGKRLQAVAEPVRRGGGSAMTVR